MELSWHAFNSMIDGGQNSVTLKYKELGTHGFHKEFQTPNKPAEGEPSFRRSAYPLQTPYAFPRSPLGLERFGHKATPPHRSWNETYYSEFQLA